jgi:hypothetical protein
MTTREIEASALAAEEEVGRLLTGILSGLILSVGLFWAPLIIWGMSR